MIATVDLDIAERCAKGPKQLGLVREFAEGPIVVTYDDPVPGYRNFNAPRYGLNRLTYSSYSGLKRRMQEQGFRFEERRAEVPNRPSVIRAVEVWREA